MRINSSSNIVPDRTAPLAPAGPLPAAASSLTDQEKAAVLTKATEWLTFNDGAHMKERMPLYEGLMQAVTRGDRQLLLEHGSAPTDLQDSLQLAGFTLSETNPHDDESYMRHELSKLDIANTAIREYEKRHPAASVTLKVYEAVNPKATAEQTLSGLGKHEDAKALFRLYEQRAQVLQEIHQHQGLKLSNLL